MSTDCADTQTIPRILRYASSDDPNQWVSLPQSGILDRAEPLVILGEAGMGKSTLLEWLASHAGYALCTARGLVNRHDPRQLLGDAEILVIDALDEFAANKDGEAVDAVLRKLGELDYPHFVLSCRVADWRSATGTEAIREQYGLQPAELYLEPLTEDEIATYLAARMGSERATTVREQIAARGLGNMLGNPQTLDLIAKVAASGNLPETKHELFARAVALMWRDQNEKKVGRQPAETIGLDAAGAACAALIITGSETITRGVTPHGGSGDLALQEITLLPGGAMIDAALDTRLFRAHGNHGFSYWHRSIGEFLGAQWLAKHADTPRKRRRLLSLFRCHGLVPASLRGIHAWLAHDPKLAQAVIEADPLGFVEYGDTNKFATTQARHLLQALRRVADANPYAFGWTLPAAKGLFHPELIDDIQTTVTSPDTPFGLRRYLIEAVRKSTFRTKLSHDLRQLILDPGTIFAIRSSAIETIANELEDDDWRVILRSLHGAGDESSLRLAVEVLNVAGHHLADDATVADLVIATIDSNERLVGAVFPLDRDLPDARLDGVLNQLAAKTKARVGPNERPGDPPLADFARTLLTRRLAIGNVTARQLWHWLEPFEFRAGYHDEERNSVETYIRSHADLRCAVQRLVMLDESSGGSIRERACRLAECSPSLQPSSTDIVALLQLLDSNDATDKRWVEMVETWGQDASVRAASRRFVTGDPESLAWIDTLTNPPEPEWQRERTQRQRERAERKALARKELRESYLSHLDEIRSGAYGWVIVRRRPI